MIFPRTTGTCALLSVGLLSPTFARQDLGRSPVHRARPSGVERPTRVDEREPVADAEQAARPASFPAEFRTIDGFGNNLQRPELGAAEAVMMRMLAPDYADGEHAPSGARRPGPREVSNAMASQVGSIPNERGASDYLWMWGQFLDHDVVETPLADPPEPFDVVVPAGDAWFDPAGTGAVIIPLSRSAYEVVAGARQQVNVITAFIDGSNVYGSDEHRMLELRTLDGTGRLKTSAGGLLPFNSNGLPNAPSTAPSFFLAGDIRANEQVALTAMHTLFVREHNHWATRLGVRGTFAGDELFELARAIVAAELQAISYREFLPVLLGPRALPPYRGYRPQVNPSIANEFAAAAYRVGHTMLSPQLLRLDADGTPHVAGHLPLAQAFFDPTQVTSIGIEPYLRGLAAQRAQRVDPYVIDDVRNLLFGSPGAGGFDLASLNIQRGRDHGLPSYNDLRAALGGGRAGSFAEVTSDSEIRSRLASVYASIDDVDPWVGLLCEEHAPGAAVGPTLRAILSDQFARLRDGDRFWYRAYLPAAMADWVDRQTLARIIRRNTGIDSELPDDVFHAQ